MVCGVGGGDGGGNGSGSGGKNGNGVAGGGSGDGGDSGGGGDQRDGWWLLLTWSWSPVPSHIEIGSLRSWLRPVKSRSCLLLDDGCLCVCSCSPAMPLARPASAVMDTTRPPARRRRGASTLPQPRDQNGRAPAGLFRTYSAPSLEPGG